MASLTSQTVASSYVKLLITDSNSGLSGTATNIEDGDGTASPLYLSTTKLGIGNASPATALDVTGAITISTTSALAGTVSIGGGYGSTGITLSDAGVIQANGAMTIDGASTLTGAVTASSTAAIAGTTTIGGGYGSTGVTLSDAGVVQMNGALTVGGASTLTGAVTASSTMSIGSNLSMTGNILMTDDTSIGIADDAERIEFDGAGDISFLGCNVGIGTTTPETEFEVSKSGGSAGLYITSYHDDAANYSTLSLRKADGTEGDEDKIADNDILGAIDFVGWDKDSGGNFLVGATIRAVVNGAPDENDMPTDLEFWTNDGSSTATQRMTILESGNVGIGETSPAVPLQVTDTSATGSVHSLLIKSNRIGYGALGITGQLDDTATRYTGITFGDYGTGKHKAGIFFECDASGSNQQGDLHICVDTADDSSNVVKGDAKITIVHEGNVGVGTVSPDYKLDVSGSANDATRTVNIKNVVSASSSGGGVLQVSHDDGSLMTSGHRLGSIDFAGAESSAYSAGANQLDIGASIFANAYGTWSVSNHPTALYFATCKDGTDETPQKRMAIIDTGLVGIGTATPSTLLEVEKDQNTTTTIMVDNNTSGTAAIASFQCDADAASGRFRTYSSGYSTSGYNVADSVQVAAFSATGGLNFVTDTGDFHFWANTTEAVTIKSDGKVGIGTASPTAELHIDQASSSGALPVLKLDQADVDDSFIDFIGTSAADGSRSVSSDTTTDSAKFGAIRIEINGVTKWIRIYDDHS